jgi:hypothetical protein
MRLGTDDEESTPQALERNRVLMVWRRRSRRKGAAESI